MNNLNIEICVGTKCVMNGAMDIMQSIENLKEISSELSEQYNSDIEINITTVKCLEGAKHHCSSPWVSINGEIFENTNSETIMAEIIDRMKWDVV